MFIYGIYKKKSTTFSNIMKRKYKQWCSTIPPISIKQTNTSKQFLSIIPPYIQMLDFHWIKAMLFFCKYYDFLQFFLHHGIFSPPF